MPALKHTLTGDDLALAMSGASLAIAWWKNRQGKRRRPSKFERAEIAKYEALIDKLGIISQYAYPPILYIEDEIAVTDGGAPIMRLNAPAVRKTRAAAYRANHPRPNKPPRRQALPRAKFSRV